jgi:hypothetical protein
LITNRVATKGFSLYAFSFPKLCLAQCLYPPETGPYNEIEPRDDDFPQRSCGGFLITRRRTFVENIANGRLIAQAKVAERR